MHDLTRGSIHGHIARLSGFMLVGMLFQTLYYLVDLYFVASIGSAAIAAVGLAGNLMFVSIALTQALTVGTTTLVAHALGAKDPARARFVFNQSLALSVIAALAFTAAALALSELFARSVTADEATAQALREYLRWFLPGLGVQFLMVSIGAALRGAGEVRAPMLVQVVSLLVNTALAPVLIAGWGTGRPLGVVGAGLATFIAMLVGAALLLLWVRKRHDVLTFEPQHWRPDFALWRRLLAIGLPSGGEFLLMSVYMTVIYWVIRDFGSSAQAGFGVGMRIMQTGFMPGLAIAFAIAPIAAQNFGAHRFDRVRESFRDGAIWVSGAMLAFMLVCLFSAHAAMRAFSNDPEAVAVGTEMLGILSFNFVASGLIMLAGSLFQALGNTMPSLIASASRIVLFAIPAVWLSRRPGFQLVHLWWLSVGSVVLQLCASLWMLRGQMRRRLVEPMPAPQPA